MQHHLLQRDRPAPRATRPEDGASIGKTKGQVEAEIAEAVVGYHRSRIGRGPESIRATILDDMIVIRHRGSLSPEVDPKV